MLYGEWRGLMINIFSIILALSTVGEFIPIPGIEINQFVILIIFPLFYIKIKDRYGCHPKNIIVLIVFILYGYILLQGSIMTYDLVEFIKTIKNYTISFMFILMVISLNSSEYKTILKKYINFCSIFFIFEFFLGYFNFTSIYNMLFIQPYADIRHMGNFLSPNSYGIIIAFIMIGNLYLYVQQKQKVNMLFLIGLSLPMLTTVSRSAVIILLIGVIIFIFIKFRIGTKIIIILTTFISLLYILSDKFVMWLYKYYSSYYARRFILYLESGNLYGDRSNEYKTIFKLYKTSWFTGLGFGNITGNNELYQGMSSMHNEYYRFFIEGGIIGGLLFLVIVIILLYSIIKLYKIKNVDKNTKALFITYTIMFLIAELQYNFFDAHREGILLIFFGFSVITIFSKGKNLNDNNLNLYYGD